MKGEKVAMNFLFERCKKISQELKTYIYPEKIVVNEFFMKEGHFRSPEEVEKSAQQWSIYKSTDKWGGKNKNFWFKFYFTFPKSFDNKLWAINVYTNSEGWDATNPQFMLYLNNNLIQGIDVNHRDVLFFEKAKFGETVKIDLHAYSGMIDKPLHLFVEINTFELEVWKLYHSLNLLIQIIEILDENNYKKWELINLINQAVNMLDLRRPYSKDFYDSVAFANKFIEEEIFLKNEYNDVEVDCIGHTHIDIAWLWRVEQTKQKAARTFCTMLKLMDEYSNFIFMSSQPQLYEFVKNEYPYIYNRIKQKIKEGKWEAEGAMWLEADCNLTSGESLVRQILYGKRFFKEEFGIESKVLWLPDVFGFPATLPQIIAKCGIEYFVTSKISWNQYNKFPYDVFLWKGIDGTEIKSYFLTAKDFDAPGYITTYNGNITPKQLRGTWERFQQKNLINKVLLTFGYGDGGGGPTREMLENAKRLERGVVGCPKLKIKKVKDFLEEIFYQIKMEGKKLPKWVGELYLEYHRGTYTSMAQNKRFNRKSEISLQIAEIISSIANEFGSEYPEKLLDDCWKKVLLNQFHDILPGSSIKEVYEDSKEDYSYVLNNTNKIISEKANLIASMINLEEDSIIVFNPTSFLRDDICVVEIPSDYVGCEIRDDKGNITNYQIIDEDKLNRKTKILFIAKDVPSIGYKTYRITNKNMNLDIEHSKNQIRVTESEIENKYWLIVFDEKGRIKNLYDKINKREVIKQGKYGNKIVAFEDKPLDFDNWDIDIFYKEKNWEIDNIKSIKVIYSGPVVGILRIEREFLDSLIVQDICVYDQIPRIDFKTYIDWKERQILLKAFFPVDINAFKATFDIQFGNIERNTHTNTSWDEAKFEVYAHKWVDISEDNYGVSILNDCKYGYSVDENEIGITLLKSGIYPNEEADKEKHYFVYSIYPHIGTWKEAETVKWAYGLNYGFLSVYKSAQKGSLPQEKSFVNVDSNNVVIETIKKACDGRGYIVRVYEFFGRRSRINLNWWCNINKVFECDMLENDLIEIFPVNKNRFEFEIKPYEIKTFRIVT